MLYLKQNVAKSEIRPSNAGFRSIPAVGGSKSETISKFKLPNLSRAKSRDDQSVLYFGFLSFDFVSTARCPAEDLKFRALCFSFHKRASFLVFSAILFFCYSISASAQGSTAVIYLWIM